MRNFIVGLVVGGLLTGPTWAFIRGFTGGLKNPQGYHDAQRRANETGQPVLHEGVKIYPKDKS